MIDLMEIIKINQGPITKSLCRELYKAVVIFPNGLMNVPLVKSDVHSGDVAPQKFFALISLLKLIITLLLQN